MKEIRAALDTILKTRLDFKPLRIVELLKNDRDLQEEKRINSELHKENTDLKDEVIGRKKIIINLLAALRNQRNA